MFLVAIFAASELVTESTGHSHSSNGKGFDQAKATNCLRIRPQPTCADGEKSVARSNRVLLVFFNSQYINVELAPSLEEEAQRIWHVEGATLNRCIVSLPL